MDGRAVSLRPQPWRWSRPRVLVEHPDEAAGLAIAAGLRLAGYAVAICPGPDEPGRCPLTGPDGCIAAHDADLVVSCLGYERPAAQEVVQALLTRCPQVPLVVELPAGAAESTSPHRRFTALAAPATPEQVVTAVQDRLGTARNGGQTGA